MGESATRNNAESCDCCGGAPEMQNEGHRESHSLDDLAAFQGRFSDAGRSMPGLTGLFGIERTCYSEYNSFYPNNNSQIMIYPSLTKLRTFAAVAEQGSFRKASTQLHLSQPALSAHIRDLEQSLGVPLFHRTTRKVQLTAEGERFLARTRRALDEIESGLLEIRDQAELQRGRVIIAAVPMIACHVVPKVLALFSQRHPLVKVQILDVIGQTMARQILDRDVDIGIGPSPERNDDLEFLPVLRDPLVAVFPEKHELAGKRGVRLDELAKLKLLTLATGTTVRSDLDQAFERQGLSLRPVFEVFQQYTLGGMVEAGLGIALLPAMSLSMLRTPRLRAVPIVDPEIVREVGLIQRRDQNHPPSVRAFLDAFSDTFDLETRISAHRPKAKPRIRERKRASRR
ncbi:MAG: LysR family transcriptional regulator [Hyphomicrobiales bacterium]|nr:LysR family transcriptional regulator [Hyphomicrobiales bacterium]